MPIYECHCIRCDLTFEVLAAVGEANRRRPCPECGKLSPRIASTFAITGGGTDVPEQHKADRPRPALGRKPRQVPLCLQNPHIPLLCHMDEPSARRWVAHFNGRGAEYDDKQAAGVESRKKHGLPPSPEPAPSGHLHGHEHNPRRHSNGAAASTSHAHGAESHHHQNDSTAHRHDHGHHGSEHHSTNAHAHAHRH